MCQLFLHLLPFPAELAQVLLCNFCLFCAVNQLVMLHTQAPPPRRQTLLPSSQLLLSLFQAKPPWLSAPLSGMLLSLQITSLARAMVCPPRPSDSCSCLRALCVWRGYPGTARYPGTAPFAHRQRPEPVAPAGCF